MGGNKAIDKKNIRWRIRKYGMDALFLFVGCAIGACATMSVMIPNGLTGGGITGLARILQSIFPAVNFSVLYYGFSIVIWFACLLLLGFKEARKIIVMTVIYPLFLFAFEHLDIRFLNEKDVILAAVYCGIFYGVCNGLVFSRGFSFGGADTVAKIISKRLMPHVGVSKILLCMDVAIIVASGFVFGRNIALYAIITSIILARVTDYVLYGFETRIVEVEIISDRHKEISDYIMNEVERGVSSSVIRGEYTGTERRKTVTLCSPREGMLIRSYVASLDRNALITVIHVDSVWGRDEGFRDIEGE
ncbi:MAG: YitT family protein [Clostridiales Family XIII bacterium]|nr:YitT family protein [Clostridiales Family XIII bacterium]